MHRRLALLAIVAGVLAMVTVTQAAAAMHCGTQNTAGGPSRLIASRVSCGTARRVMHDFGVKGFRGFVGPDHATGYTPVDGWRCVLFDGFSSCTHAHAVIAAEPLHH
jgi:hypothetical protein